MRPATRQRKHAMAGLRAISGEQQMLGTLVRVISSGKQALDALTMALQQRPPTTGLLHHSDRGSQYAATSYQQLLTAHGVIASMSRKGNCWDNACVDPLCQYQWDTLPLFN